MRPASMAACTSAGTTVTLSMVAVCRATSSFTSRQKCERMAGLSRRSAATTRCTTCRTRFSSSPRFTRQRRNSCSASRFARLLIFMGLRRNSPRGLLGESALIFRRQNLAGHRGGRLHHQPTDLALELGEHAVMVSGGGFACTDRDLFRGRDGLLGLLLPHPGGGGPGLIDQGVRLRIRLHHHFLPWASVL